MKISQVIELVDQLTYNQIDTPVKVMWLSDLDWLITLECHKHHEVTKDIPFEGYNCDTPLDTELLVPPPYCEVYRWYLEMKIHDVAGEILKYNNAVAKYQNAIVAYYDYVNRTYAPLGAESLKLV